MTPIACLLTTDCVPRYAHKTGLPFAMFPGSVAGLPPDMATMPQLLRQAGYSAHMVGKWHIGHAQRAQTPVGRGFESHVGSFMWDLESYTKMMWRGPGWAVGRDWGRHYENGSSEHWAEPRHATLAITQEAEDRMREHREDQGDKPLFLYVSYNAAHSPLQPEPDWEAECGHIPHLWRREFCAMVVGLDKAIASLADTARSILGENTVIVVSPDNGGSTWFGGNNEPLRGAKLTPFEGGVRVPAFMLDFSRQYSSVPATGSLDRMVHVTDWLPTFLSWAGASQLTKDLGLDGLDQTQALLTGQLVRREMVLEMYTKEDSHDGTESVAYRNGRFKIVQGHFRDPHWYSEPVSDMVATSDDDSWTPRLLELIVRIAEWIFGNGPTDIMPHGMLLNVILFNHHIKRQGGVKTWLFDLEKDPNEMNDLVQSKAHHKILRSMVLTLQEIKYGRPVPTHQYWYVHPNWEEDGFVPGDCSMQPSGLLENCKFAHPWLEDDADLFDLEGLGLENNMESTKTILLLYATASVGIILIFVLIACKIFGKIFFSSQKNGDNKHKKE